MIYEICIIKKCDIIIALILCFSYLQYYINNIKYNKKLILIRININTYIFFYVYNKTKVTK